MELVLLIAGAVALAALLPRTPPRHKRVRGAERWTDADDAQRRHLDHWGLGADPNEGGEE